MVWKEQLLREKRRHLVGVIGRGKKKKKKPSRIMKDVGENTVTACESC